MLRKRQYLKITWCFEVLRAPDKTEVQRDGRIKHWGYVEELGKWLRGCHTRGRRKHPQRFSRQRLLTMKLHYYGETDSLYIELSDAAGAESREVAPGIVLDYAANGALVGIDIDQASSNVSLGVLETIDLPIGKVRVA